MSTFITPSTSFAKALAQIVPAVPTRGLVPITENVLIVGTGSVVGEAASLRLVGTNLETTLITDVATECVENFAVCVPARKLLTTLKGFPDCPLTCIVDEAGLSLELKAGRSRYKLSGEPPMDFPKRPTLARAHQTITMPTAQLRAALSATLPFVLNNDDIRPYFSAILFETTEHELRVVGSEGNRIAVYQVPIENAGYDAEDEAIYSASWSHSDTVLVPKAAAQMLLSLLDPKASESTTLHIDTETVRLAGGQWVARRMDQPYPQYRGIIPAVHTISLDLDRDELLAALRRLVAHSPEETNTVALHIAESGEVTITADNTKWGTEGQEVVSGVHQYDPKELVIGFSAQHLIELLQVWPGGAINFALDEPNRSAVLTLASEADEPTITCLVAPRPVNVAVPA